jgi:hypothetical protein
MIFAPLLLLVLITIIGVVAYLIARNLDELSSFRKFMLGVGLSVILLGMFIVTLLVLAAMSKSRVIMYPLLAAGLSQLIYIIPLGLFLAAGRQYDIMKGLITGAILIAILNGGFFLAVPFIGKFFQ